MSHDTAPHPKKPMWDTLDILRKHYPVLQSRLPLALDTRAKLDTIAANRDLDPSLVRRAIRYHTRHVHYLKNCSQPDAQRVDVVTGEPVEAVSEEHQVQAKVSYDAAMVKIAERKAATQAERKAAKRKKAASEQPPEPPPEAKPKKEKQQPPEPKPKKEKAAPTQAAPKPVTVQVKKRRKPLLGSEIPAPDQLPVNAQPAIADPPAKQWSETLRLKPKK